MENKESINKRFIESVQYILQWEKKGKMADSFQISSSKFSEILSERMKAGVELYSIIVSNYNINAEWLLTGNGSMIKEAKPFEVEQNDIKEMITMMEKLNKKQNEVIEKLSSIDGSKKCD